MIPIPMNDNPYANYITDSNSITSHKWLLSNIYYDTQYSLFHFMIEHDGNPIWLRNIKINNIDELERFIRRRGIDKRKHNIYRSTYNINWVAMNRKIGKPVSPLFYDEYKKYRGSMVDALKQSPDTYITNREMVFEIDHRKGGDISDCVPYIIEILDILESIGVEPVYVYFSGGHGFHIVCPKSLDLAKTMCQTEDKKWDDDLKQHSRWMIEAWGQLLDICNFERWRKPAHGAGRVYDDVDMHTSPLYPQGIRKAPYSITRYNTIVIPLTWRQLLTNLTRDDYKYGKIKNKIKLYKRGDINILEDRKKY